jgi:predicted O-methyltransferase YrrM
VRSALHRLDRIRGRLRPHAPWLTPASVRYLDAQIQKPHRVFEWGSGRSTSYFAGKCSQVRSIEHDAQWYRLVAESLKQGKQDHARLEFFSLEDPRYISCILEEETLYDWILVDGRKRSACLSAAIQRLAPKGRLIIDNSDRDEIRGFLSQLDPKRWSAQHFPNWISCTSVLSTLKA